MKIAEKVMDMTITKTDYLLYKQCGKSFWLEKTKPEVMKKEEQDNDERNEVLSLAYELFPSGLRVQSKSIKEKTEQTKKAIQENISVIYGATFQVNEAVATIDIMRLTHEGWSLYKVTSSTGVKERHMDELAYQFAVISHVLPISSVNVVHLNKEYVRQGELNVRELFRIDERLEEVYQRSKGVDGELEQMQKLESQGFCEREIGSHCDKYGKDASPCPARAFCWGHIPEYSVFNITRIGKKGMDLYKEGIVNIEDIPEDYKLSEAQKIQVDIHKNKTDIIDKKKIREFLKTFTFPLYFLDFETYQQTIPLYEGIKPYQQVPFQYSLHVLNSYLDELKHKEYLAKEGTDSRRELAERLVRDIPKNVCVVAYNMSFEKSVIKNLSELFPDLAEHLMNIHDNIVDLMVPFQKKWYYTNTMKGSYSIKYVLPALLPNDDKLDYKQLTIQNGSMAMNLFAKLHTYPKHEIEQIREDLKAYCGLDTYAMVRIWEVLYLL